jgi:DNA-binding CsgD family transcriptional regulator
VCSSDLLRTAQELESDEEVRAWQVQDDSEVFVVVSLPVRGGRWQWPLTEAERNIVDQILEGGSNKEIAERRGTSARTVANQISGIYQKLGIASRAELAALVARQRTSQH